MNPYNILQNILFKFGLVQYISQNAPFLTNTVAFYAYDVNIFR